MKNSVALVTYFDLVLFIFQAFHYAKGGGRRLRDKSEFEGTDTGSGSADTHQKTQTVSISFMSSLPKQNSPKDLGILKSPSLLHSQTKR